jgi:hypothetical protein
MKAVDPSILKGPPQNLEAEQSVSGASSTRTGAEPGTEIMEGPILRDDT